MRLEKKATLISTFVAGILVVIKMTIGILSGSIAVLASAIDSFLDLTVSLFNFFALNSAEKDPDDKFHYGRSKIEPLASVIEGVVISASALFILNEALIKIFHPRTMEHIDSSIIVMVISFVITMFLVMFLTYVAKKTDSMVIRADALHYKTDFFSNGAILIALAVIYFTDFELIDPLLGIGISIYMIYSAIPIIKEGVLMLLDAALPKEDIDNILKIIKNDTTVTDYHFLQTREAGSSIFISVHLVFNVDISLYDAHLVSDKIEDQIKDLFKNKKTHVIIHLDPYDDSQINQLEERF